MTPPAPFSLVPLTGKVHDLPEPANGPYYVATSSGYMFHQNFHWGRVITPVKAAPNLEKGEEILWHDIQFPAELISRAWSFFRAVFEKDHSEAMVDITWHRDRGYRLFVPPQTASAGGVRCIRNEDHYKGLLVGTIHSHCDFSAFHSGTDTHDADGHDGLHMTIGHVDSDELDIAIMVSVDTIRWDLKLNQIIGDTTVTPSPFPAWWMNQMKDSLPGATEGFKPAAQTSWGTRKPTTTPNDGIHITCIHGADISFRCYQCEPSQKPASNVPALTGPARQTKPHRNVTFYSLDALVYSLNPNDPRVAQIEEIQQYMDLVMASLDEIGIDLDYEVRADYSANHADRPTLPDETLLNRILQGAYDYD